MNQATRTHLFASAVAGDPTMALVFIERNLWVQFVSMKGQTVQITNLNKGQCEEVVSLLLEWSKPGWYARAEKWENTARQATAELRKVKEELRCANNRVETYRADILKVVDRQRPLRQQAKALQIKLDHERLVNQDMAAKLADVQAKLAQALDRSAIIANDYIQLRKVAEHNEKIMDQAIGELKRMAKEAGIELPTPAGQLAACEVSTPAKPLAYIMPPSKENGNANFLLFAYTDGKPVFDHHHQGIVEAKARELNYQLLAPWDPRHPFERTRPNPVSLTMPQPEQGSSDDVPVRPFMPPRQSPQQRPGNVLHIKESRAWGHPRWRLYKEDGELYSPKATGDFCSLEQAIQWCKRHDFDYRY